MADSEDETNWTIDLETSLIEGCDFGTLRGICKGRPVPDHLRAEVWQICLGVAGKADPLVAFDELFDMKEQSILREDCYALVEKFGNDEEEKLSVASDLESILTFYCKSRGLKYERDCGWLEILQPLIALKFTKADLYNTLYSLSMKYIPRDCNVNESPFHLFRLLLLYHEPELCSFLDSRKITPDIYAYSWFRSLFSSVCDLRVILKMWDVYLQQADPYLVFFLALVIVVNAKEQVLTMKQNTKSEIVETLSAMPTALEADDIEDFCSLAQYYASRTPQSFRKEYQSVLFGTGLGQLGDIEQRSVSQVLCLPASVSELLAATQAAPQSEEVRYFVVDCRPAEQYNSGHLPIAFHLDANLMLQNPVEFQTAVQALIMSQQQAIAASSAAGGEHLCFMGSGREEEDQYVNMVVAHFLQKNTQFVSVVNGGYQALHSTLGENATHGLLDHNSRYCIVCNPDASSNGGDTQDEFQTDEEEESLLGRFGKLSTVVKSKSALVKEKMINYIKNEGAPHDRHVSSTDPVGKPYRNTVSVFSIAEEPGDATSQEDNVKDVVNIDLWLNKAEMKYSYQCKEITETGYTYASYLLVTSKHMFILRETVSQPGMAQVQARRSLGSVVKITSKKRHPELITFKYGSNDAIHGLIVTDMDRLLIPEAGEATKVIKQLIMKVLDVLDS